MEDKILFKKCPNCKTGLGIIQKDIVYDNNEPHVHCIKCGYLISLQENQIKLLK